MGIHPFTSFICSSSRLSWKLRERHGNTPGMGCQFIPGQHARAHTHPRAISHSQYLYPVCGEVGGAKEPQWNWVKKLCPSYVKPTWLWKEHVAQDQIWNLGAVRLPCFPLHHYPLIFKSLHVVYCLFFFSQADPIRVLVTGAAGQIAYSLLYGIAKGDVFGKDQVNEFTHRDTMWFLIVSRKTACKSSTFTGGGCVLNYMPVLKSILNINY